jgi:hypothetical protein
MLSIHWSNDKDIFFGYDLLSVHYISNMLAYQFVYCFRREVASFTIVSCSHSLDTWVMMLFIAIFRVFYLQEIDLSIFGFINQMIWFSLSNASEDLRWILPSLEIITITHSILNSALHYQIEMAACWVSMKL